MSFTQRIDDTTSIQPFILLMAMALLAFTLAATIFSTPVYAAHQTPDGAVISQGQFSGLNNHVVTGRVEIVETADGLVALLSDDFVLDGAPDPQLAFGHKGQVDPRSIFTKLGKIRGQQAYRIPAGLDPANFTEFYVHCVRFDVPLGVASLI
ncbi:MAG: DM13 domain-containing protein [Pseudomonadota bacterium]